MPNQQDVADGLYAKLIDDTTPGSFYGELDGRIYEAEGPQNEKLPMCVMYIVDATPLMHFGNSNNWELQMQIDIYNQRSKGARVLREIGDKLLALLDRQDINVLVAGMSSVYVWNTSQGAPTIEEDAYRQTSQWTIHAS